MLEFYQRKFQYIHVDEYQDTNRAQYLLVKQLAARLENICVVGDSDQSIYRWRGADIANILSFEKDYPSANVILLEQNYRSTKRILQAANEVIKNNSNRKPKTCGRKMTKASSFLITAATMNSAKANSSRAKFMSCTARAGGSFPISRFYTGQTPSRASLRKPF